jgi:uncharacterized protein YjbJ (UPF0337 family)
MAVMLNKDILSGKWKQIRGKVRQQWGKLTDNQLDQIGGNYEQLVGVIQENYGYTREMAEQEVNDFMRKLNSTVEKQRNTTR